MHVEFHHKGDFDNTEKFLNKLKNNLYLKKLDKYGEMGVEALKKATPKRTGKTSESWIYKINHGTKSTTITWTNTNTADGVPIAILLDLGHGTGRGTYVQGKHYIAPAMEPVFDKIARDAWEEVTSKL